MRKKAMIPPSRSGIQTGAWKRCLRMCTQDTHPAWWKGAMWIGLIVRFWIWSSLPTRWRKIPLPIYGSRSQDNRRNHRLFHWKTKISIMVCMCCTGVFFRQAAIWQSVSLLDITPSILELSRCRQLLRIWTEWAWVSHFRPQNCTCPKGQVVSVCSDIKGPNPAQCWCLGHYARLVACLLVILLYQPWCF